MSAPSMTEQVEALILWAAERARDTGIRQRVFAGRLKNGGWYYQTQDTNLFPYPLRVVMRNR